METVEHFEPTTNTQQTLYGQGIMLNQVLDDNRELRLLESYQGVPLTCTRVRGRCLAGRV